MKSYDEEPFYTLWSSLCHQGDIYSASYAAIPIFVSLIESGLEKVDYKYFLLPVSIEIARLKGNGPKIDTELESNYFEAISSMGKLTGRINTIDGTMISVLSAATAVCHGKAALAEAILELTPDTLMDFQEWLEDR